MIRKQLLAASLLLASPLVFAEGDAAQGQAVFAANCGFCHSTEAGVTLMGPSLVGVAGKEHAQVAGFNYSAPFKAAQLTWDDETLDKWLANPANVVAGNMMMFPGLADEASRQNVIAYLKTLK